MDITLALGGGGVKGFAHVGVLEVLEAEGFRIRAIAGTSAGSMVGAAYAAGCRPDEITQHLMRMDQSKLYNRLPGDGPSLLGLGGVTRELKALIGDRDFNQLGIPFACTAVDLEDGELRVLDTGQVLDAVLTSIALPGIFPPRVWGGRLMVDGGVLDPVPVSLARKLAPGVPVVAVVLSPPLAEWKNRRSQPPRLLNSIPLLSRLYQLRLAQSFNIFLRSVDIAGCLLTDLRLQLDKPEVIIRPGVAPIGFLDRVDVESVVKLGEEAAREALPALRNVVGWRWQLSNRIPWLSDFLIESNNDA